MLRSISRYLKAKHILQYSFICVLVFVGMFIVNYITIYTGDDYLYHFFFEQGRVNEFTRSLTGIADIPASMWNHYQLYNGRIIAHSIVQFFMLFDKSVFDICNSIVFVITGFLLLFNIQPDCKKWKPWHLGMIYLLMWLCIPDFGLSVLWVSGAANYLWMSMLLLFLMAFYRRYHELPYDHESGGFLKAVLIIPVAFACGWSSENGGGAVSGLIFLIIMIWIFEKKHIPVWAVAGELAACAGVGFLLNAPSSEARMDTEYTMAVFLKRIREIVGFSYHYLLLLYILFLALAVLVIRQRMKTGRDWKKDIMLPTAYMMSGAASVVVLLASPIIMGKSWMWAVFTTMCAIGQLLWTISDDGLGLKKSELKGISVLLLALTLFIYLDTSSDLMKTYSEYQIQLSEIQRQKEQGIQDVTVPLLSETENKYNPIMKTPNVSTDKDTWFNEWMAIYYGVDSITGVESTANIN